MGQTDQLEVFRRDNVRLRDITPIMFLDMEDKTRL